MNVESAVCKAIVDRLKASLDGVEIDGNWLTDNAAKGVLQKTGAWVDVNVETRSYSNYTTAVAELKVTIVGALPFAHDTTFSRTSEIYDALVGILDEWQDDISAVKRDLTAEGIFNPVGFRLSGGQMEVDRETKSRNFNQTLTLKGRIKK